MNAVSSQWYIKQKYLADFLKTNLACNDLSERRQKAGFLGPISPQITLTKERTAEKGKARWKKGRIEKKAMVALLDFIMATLEIAVGRKKPVGRKRSICR